ncbi:hypothetical protein F4779DRAFT_632348 [Xylariaceae sp. FL0662B]|nr:hypothetical protein F4779DRAFT_632348 [Xylariaceae sp. FL0662B]
MFSNFHEALRQSAPGKPTFAPKQVRCVSNNKSDTDAKVHLVTGSNAGVGKEVAQILFSKNATVWVAVRNEEKGRQAIESIKKAHPSSTGKLELLRLDLGDLTTIKKSAETFLAKENQLHVLYNNAGVMSPPYGSKSAQGYELQLATNNLGPFLFTKLLTPLLAETAKASPKNSVRVVWVSSTGAERFTKIGGIDFDNLGYKMNMFFAYKYGMSKAGNYYHATEYARRHRDDGIVSVALNPGNLDSDLYRHCNIFVRSMWKAVLYPPLYGAYTELYAGTSDDVALDSPGDWIAPWGRFCEIRKDLLEGSKPESEGGTGIAQKFWEWTEEQVRPYE